MVTVSPVTMAFTKRASWASIAACTVAGSLVEPICCTAAVSDVFAHASSEVHARAASQRLIDRSPKGWDADYGDTVSDGKSGRAAAPVELKNRKSQAPPHRGESQQGDDRHSDQRGYLARDADHVEDEVAARPCDRRGGVQSARLEHERDLGG